MCKDCEQTVQFAHVPCLPAAINLATARTATRLVGTSGSCFPVVFCAQFFKLCHAACRQRLVVSRWKRVVLVLLPSASLQHSIQLYLPKWSVITVTPSFAFPTTKVVHKLTLGAAPLSTICGSDNTTQMTRMIWINDTVLPKFTQYQNNNVFTESHGQTRTVVASVVSEPSVTAKELEVTTWLTYIVRMKQMHFPLRKVVKNVQSGCPVDHASKVSELSHEDSSGTSMKMSHCYVTAKC